MAERRWAAEEHRASRASSCRKGGCRLDLTGLEVDEITILDCDRADHLFGVSGPEGASRRPDYLLFLERQGSVVVLIVEMKSGANARAKEVLEQAAAGCRVVERLIVDGDVRGVIPLLAHGGIDATQELAYLRTHGVRCAGPERLIVPVRCGGRLQPVLRRLLGERW